MHLNRKWLLINTFFFLVIAFIAYIFFDLVRLVSANTVLQINIGSSNGIDIYPENVHSTYLGIMILFIPAICVYYYFRVTEKANNLEEKFLIRPYLILIVFAILLGQHLSGSFSLLISLSVTPILFWNISKKQLMKNAFIATVIIYGYSCLHSIIFIGIDAFFQVGFVMWANLWTPTSLFFIWLYQMFIGFLFIKMINPHVKIADGISDIELIKKLYDERFVRA